MSLIDECFADYFGVASNNQQVCVCKEWIYEGNTYLIYEYAENGSLTNWLHDNKYPGSFPLAWKNRDFRLFSTSSYKQGTIYDTN